MVEVASFAFAASQLNYEPPQTRAADRIYPPGFASAPQTSRMPANVSAALTRADPSSATADARSAASSSGIIEDGAMTLSVDVPPDAQPLQGSILRGKGFRVWADWQASPHGTLRFYFQQMYRGLPLNEWSGGTGYPNAFEGGVNIDMPAPDSTPYRVSLEYDLHTLRLAIGNATQVLTNYVLWRDNMTDALGNDGPKTLPVDPPAISNVAFTPAKPRAPSPYVWEGVIGNTSHAIAGPEVHAPWWPISKMVSRGSNVFYTGGYNEGKWDVQKFDALNPQVVVTN